MDLDTRREDRVAQLSKLGLRYNGEEFIQDDINVHHTEIICDTEEQWNKKITKIEKEINRRKALK